MSAILRSGLGAAAWAVFAALRVSSLQDETWAHALLLFAALVLVPLALDLFPDPGGEDPPGISRVFWWLERVMLPAGLLLLAACWLPAGTLAALLALPWVAVTALLAWIGVARVRHGGLRRELDGLSRDAGLMFAAIGGAWVLADRVGFSPLGFSPTIVALTAVHFHYAGVLLPLFAGLVQRELFFWRLASRAVVGVVLGVPAVALGITATQLGWGSALEKAAGCGLALAGMAVGVLHVRLAVDGKQQPLATRMLLGVAGISIFVGMVFAAVYALRGAIAAPALGIPQMRALHGTINALGFGLCSVLAWRRMARDAVERQDGESRAIRK